MTEICRTCQRIAHHFFIFDGEVTCAKCLNNSAYILNCHFCGVETSEEEGIRVTNDRIFCDSTCMNEYSG